METFDPHHQSRHIESKIVVALERISEAFKVLLWKKGKEYGLTPLQLQLLLFVRFHPPEKSKVNYLAREFNVAKATISETVRLLGKKELITRMRDPGDSRSYSIHLSETGLELVSKISDFASVIEAPLKDMPQSRKEAFFHELYYLISRLSSDGVISVNRMCVSCKFFERSENGTYCRFLEKVLSPGDHRIDCPEHQPVG
ncbi:MarR family winged helix-turn-helix transcriptional regulator [Poritiphilus flavus]|uniref:MarR family transcriptional regulator n=1 Tax=Poritiphilus flavus TaxID=2697053 RepID=A0A6L9EH73_9FLAO|nr:MarR family winged helix-turn-helix transcriptional regulator [Poritiphilus flavus]NAS14006.1 MarR family transcriptional regulator [Poritiphilus flavus]